MYVPLPFLLCHASLLRALQQCSWGYASVPWAEKLSR